MSPQAIEKLLKSSEGRELVALLKQKIDSLDRCSDIGPADDRQIAIEVLARERAAQKLAEVLKLFLDNAPVERPPQERESGLYYDHSPQSTINPNNND